jgi:DNA-binding Lrp family transcriptional regulator
VIFTPVAYVMVNTREFDQELLKRLRNLKGVEQAYALYGTYDLIVKTNADTMEQIKEVHNKIRKQKNITSTLTMITHEE